MNTSAHMIFGAAAFGRPGAPRVTAAAVLGSLAPDVSLYLMAGWALLVAGIAPEIVFGRLYFSEGWQRVFAIDNSFLLWGAVLAATSRLRHPAAPAFVAAGLLHLGFDFALHNEDARPMFWPLSDWVFRSPFSYWDRAHYGAVIAPLEWGAVLLLGLLLWRRHRWLWARVLIVLAVLAETLASGLFGMPIAH